MGINLLGAALLFIGLVEFIQSDIMSAQINIALVAVRRFPCNC